MKLTSVCLTFVTKDGIQANSYYFGEMVYLPRKDEFVRFNPAECPVKLSNGDLQAISYSGIVKDVRHGLEQHGPEVEDSHHIIYVTIERTEDEKS